MMMSMMMSMTMTMAMVRKTRSIVTCASIIMNVICVYIIIIYIYIYIHIQFLLKLEVCKNLKAETLDAGNCCWTWASSATTRQFLGKARPDGEITLHHWGRFQSGARTSWFATKKPLWFHGYFHGYISMGIFPWVFPDFFMDFCRISIDLPWISVSTASKEILPLWWLRNWKRLGPIFQQMPGCMGWGFLLMTSYDPEMVGWDGKNLVCLTLDAKCCSPQNMHPFAGVFLSLPLFLFNPLL